MKSHRIYPIWLRGKMDDMFRNRNIQFTAGALCAVLVITLLYFLPPIHDRLSWRVDFATSFLRGALRPVSAIPTAEPETLQVVITPTIAPLPLATPTPLQPTPMPTALPASASLPAPTFEQQTMNNCGPAALSTYLRFYGWEGNQESVANILKPRPEDRNVNVEELVYFVRNNAGWLNIQYRVGGDVQLLKSLLANGIPVMVEESFHMDQKYWPNDDLWAGHYQFITGYNDATGTFVAQDTYYGPNLAISYDELENAWQSFNHVYILIYPPEKEETVKTLLGDEWDVDVNRQHTLEEARRATMREPENTFAWFNLGSNLVYFEQYNEAAAAYDQARALGFPQRMLRYQFGPFIAYFNARRTEDLMTIAKYAVNITPNSEEARLWLGWAHYRSGDRSAALSEFKKALYYNETYPDAIYALDFLANH